MTLKEKIYDILFRVFLGLTSFTIVYYMGGGTYHTFIDKYNNEGTIGVFIGFIVGMFLYTYLDNYFGKDISEDEL